MRFGSRRVYSRVLLLALPILVGCSAGSKPTPTPTPQRDVAAQVSASSGGEIGLPDGGATLKIPPGALAADTTVSIKRVAPDATNGGDFELGTSAGERFQVDLGGRTLNQQALLEIPFDPSLLPQGTDASQVFLAYYDGTAEQWVYAGGMVDTQKNVIILPITHASWWNPFTWNWGAWIAVLDKMLKGNVTDFLQAVALLTEECPQIGQSVSVDASGANNVVQGCVQKDDPQTPELRVVNPKSFYFEVKPLSGGNGYPPETMLAPGDSLRFQANTSDPSPLVISADITQKAGLYLVVDLVIQMLPGFNQLGFQSSTLACITEKASDVSYVTAATYALLVAHDGAAAAEQLVDMLGDSDAMGRFITGAKDCHYGPASTWSVEGVKQIGAATSTIISATDFIANYLLNYESHLSFSWRADRGVPETPGRPAEPETPPTVPSIPGHKSSDHLFPTIEAALADWVGGSDRLFGECQSARTAPPLDLSQESYCFFLMEERETTRLYGITSAPAQQQRLGAHVFHVFIRSVGGGWIWIKPACINPDEPPDLCDYNWPPPG